MTGADASEGLARIQVETWRRGLWWLRPRPGLPVQLPALFARLRAPLPCLLCGIRRHAALHAPVCAHPFIPAAAVHARSRRGRNQPVQGTCPTPVLPPPGVLCGWESDPVSPGPRVRRGRPSRLSLGPNPLSKGPVSCRICPRPGDGGWRTGLVGGAVCPGISRPLPLAPRACQYFGLTTTAASRGSRRAPGLTVLRRRRKGSR